MYWWTPSELKYYDQGQLRSKVHPKRSMVVSEYDHKSSAERGLCNCHLNLKEGMEMIDVIFSIR